MVTARQLNRTTLARQLLLEREPVAVPDAVRRIAALQAQEPASPYLALWNRIAGFDAADLDAAFVEQTVVKASLMRITLHAVHADDYPPFHAAMLPALRASRLYDKRFTSTGLTVADADDAVRHLVRFIQRPRTGAEIEAHFGERFGSASDTRLWWALKTFGPVHHAVTTKPWSFGQRPSYRAAPTPRKPLEREPSIQHLVRRYLGAFGPASVLDVAQFTLLSRPAIREALAALGDEVVELDGPAGSTLYDLAGGVLADEALSAPARLLPMWESSLLAYSDRSRIIPPDFRKLVIRTNGDVLPTLLVDGYVAGVWRPVEGAIEATAFGRLPKRAWDELAGEARQLVAFLADRDPNVYRRYARWWAALPATQRRVLPG
jgi:hypothetical protein